MVFILDAGKLSWIQVLLYITEIPLRNQKAHSKTHTDLDVYSKYYIGNTKQQNWT